MRDEVGKGQKLNWDLYSVGKLSFLSYVTEDLCFCMSDGFNVTGGLVYQSTTSDLECYDEDIHYPAYFRYAYIFEWVYVCNGTYPKWLL